MGYTGAGPVEWDTQGRPKTFQCLRWQGNGMVEEGQRWVITSVRSSNGSKSSDRDGHPITNLLSEATTLVDLMDGLSLMLNSSHQGQPCCD